MLLALADDLGTEGGFGACPQLSIIVLEDIKFLLDLLDSTDSNVTGLLETIGNFQGVDAFIQKFLGLLKDGASEHDHTSGAIADLVVLRGRKLGKKTSGLMMDLKQTKS